MSLVTVVATQPFTHDGRSIHKGEAVTMEALDAAVHAQARRVTLDRSVRPTYQTREMTAERPAPPVTVQDPTAAPPAVAPARTARTRTRTRTPRA